MRRKRHQRTRGFSLLEVVIVVAIIAILAAIGIPRMSRGSRGAGDSALKANLAVLRNAIDLYSAEHQGAYPTDANSLANQLTLYSDSSGNTNLAKGGDYIYGPYIRSIPPLPVGTNKGETGIGSAIGDSGAGWIYASGEIKANAADSEIDDAGVKYNAY